MARNLSNGNNNSGDDDATTTVTTKTYPRAPGFTNSPFAVPVKKVTIGKKPDAKKIADNWVAQKSNTMETTSIKRLTIDIPAELHSKIKVQCAMDGVQMADVIRDLLRKRFGEKV